MGKDSPQGWDSELRLAYDLRLGVEMLATLLPEEGDRSTRLTLGDIGWGGVGWDRWDGVPGMGWDRGTFLIGWAEEPT